MRNALTFSIFSVVFKFNILLSSPGREEVSHDVITPVEDLSLPPLLQASLPLLPPVLQDSRGTVFLLEMNH